MRVRTALSPSWRRGCAVATLALALALRPAAAQAPDTSWVARAALYEIFVQDFTPEGTLRAATAHLDKVLASGANVLWVMPVQPVGIVRHKGTLGSHYAIRDFRGVEPSYGTLDDFRGLVRSAHARGLKVILDWVPDHTAWDHPWIQSHPAYYVRDSTGAPVVPRDPAGKPTDWDDVAQLDYTNPELRAEMLAAMRFWLETCNLDGFRVDVAGFVPHRFWREAIPALRSAVPRRLLFLAEWGELTMHDDGFDLTYGWDGYKRIKEVWKGASAARVATEEADDLAAMPAGGARMRFTTNHDETAWDQPPVTLFGGPAAARAAFVAAALLPGRPLLYAGQEVESPQKLGLFEREAVAWAQPDAAAARAFYARVMRLAITERALQGRAFAPVRTSAPDDVISYRRGELLVLVNARGRAVQLTVEGAEIRGTRDLLGGHRVPGDALALPPWGAVVLRLRR